MRKSILVKALLAAALLSLIIAVPALGAGLNTGAGPWQWLRPPVQGATISDLDFIDANTGWAVGIGGTILKTTDGGANWASQVSGTNYNLWGVDFIDANRGWAVGDYGTVIYTTDGGTTWNTQSVPSPAYPMLQDISFFNSNVGVITGGGYGYYTSNGGATWNKTASINTLHSLASVQMTSATTAIAVGSGGSIYKTTDGGTTWTMPPSPTSSSLNSVYFIDANRGMAVASVGSTSGRLLRTIDGGNNWVASSTGQITTPLFAVRVIDNQSQWSVVAAGNGGVILQLTSAGGTDIWSTDIDVIAAALNTGTRSSGTVSNLMAMAFPTGQTGFVGGAGGAISKTTDYGATWTMKAGGDAVNLLGSSFPPGQTQTGWMAGNEGAVINTTDSGETWTTVNACGTCPGGTLPTDIDFQDIDFPSTSNGVAVGCQGAGCPGSGTAVAYKYTSGNWSPMTVPGGTLLYAVQMIDANNGWAVGSGSVALKTTDGTNWISTTTGLPAGADLTDVDSISAGGNAWVVGQDINGTGKGAMFLWNGATWSQTNPASAPTFMTGIDMIDANTGYASGSSGKIYKTINGGGAWTAQTSGTSKLLADISFSSATNGFAVGDEGRLLHTRDGGATWSAEDLGTNVSMFAITALGERTAFVGGSNGSVLRALRPYYFTWYDDLYSNDWVLMANPVSAASDLSFDLFIAGHQKDLSGYNNGVVSAGVSIAPKYSGVIGGPVNAASLTSDKAIVSQRILWPKGGSSIEEVLGQDIERLSNHYYWTWYDQASPGYTNWVLIANPNPYGVDYEIKIANVTKQTGTIASGVNVTPTFPGTIGGPVEVIAKVAGTNDPAFVMASQRVLSNYGNAFNEAPGVPIDELSSDYYWSWYDDVGGSNWILISNPPGAATSIDYQIYVGGQKVCDSALGTCSNTNSINLGSLVAGASVAPRFGTIDGPVEVKTFQVGTSTPANSIASQRIIIGPSFGETMGYPASDLASTYHWTWYDELSAGMRNWVLVANESGSSVDCTIKVAGATQGGGPYTIPDGDIITPNYAGLRDGPVEVACDGPVIASQRVVFNGYFNEVLGTVLN